MAEPEKQINWTRKVFGVIVGLIIFVAGVGLAFIVMFFMLWGAADSQKPLSNRVWFGTGVFIVTATGALASYVTLQISRSNRLTIFVACLPWPLLFYVLYLIAEDLAAKGILNLTG